MVQPFVDFNFCPYFADLMHTFILEIGSALLEKKQRKEALTVNDIFEIRSEHPYCYEAIKLAEKIFTTERLKFTLHLFRRDDENKEYYYKFGYRL